MLAEQMLTPEEVGRRAALRLLSECEMNSVVDTAHQIQMLHFTALANEDCASRFRLGKLSPATVQYLRDVRSFFGVSFKFKEMDCGSDGGSSVTVSCVGLGFANISRPTF